jgi:hypothetical protein
LALAFVIAGERLLALVGIAMKAKRA